MKLKIVIVCALAGLVVVAAADNTGCAVAAIDCMKDYDLDEIALSLDRQPMDAQHACKGYAPIYKCLLDVNKTKTDCVAGEMKESFKKIADETYGFCNPDGSVKPCFLQIASCVNFANIMENDAKVKTETSQIVSCGYRQLYFRCFHVVENDKLCTDGDRDIVSQALARMKQKSTVERCDSGCGGKMMACLGDVSQGFVNYLIKGDGMDATCEAYKSAYVCQTAAQGSDECKNVDVSQIDSGIYSAGDYCRTDGTPSECFEIMKSSAINPEDLKNMNPTQRCAEIDKYITNLERSKCSETFKQQQIAPLKQDLINDELSECGVVGSCKDQWGLCMSYLINVDVKKLQSSPHCDLAKAEITCAKRVENKTMCKDELKQLTTDDAHLAKMTLLEAICEADGVDIGWNHTDAAVCNGQWTLCMHYLILNNITELQSNPKCDVAKTELSCAKDVEKKDKCKGQLKQVTTDADYVTKMTKFAATCKATGVDIGWNGSGTVKPFVPAVLAAMLLAFIRL